jgi:hypothetical protein
MESSPPPTPLLIVHYIGYLLPFLQFGIVFANHDKVYGYKHRAEAKRLRLQATDGDGDNTPHTHKVRLTLRAWVKGWVYGGGEVEHGDGEDEDPPNPELVGEGLCWGGWLSIFLRGMTNAVNRGYEGGTQCK